MGQNEWGRDATVDEEQQERLERGTGQRNTWDAQIYIKKNIFLMAERTSRTGTLMRSVVIVYRWCKTPMVAWITLSSADFFIFPKLTP